MNQRIPNIVVQRFITCLLVIILGISLSGLYTILHWPNFLGILLFFIILTLRWALPSKKPFIIISITSFALMLLLVLNIQPDNTRNWASEHKVLPIVTTSNQQVTITGVRDFRWKNATQAAKMQWREESFDLTKLTSLDLIVEPFKNSDILAHTMLRFHFEDAKSIIVSVEARREDHESYNLIAGAFLQFELIYIFGTEEDLINLRAVHRNTRLYAFPVKADQAFLATLFKDLAESANQLHHKPQFYHSIRDNCTTTLVKHIDRTYPLDIGLRRETIFPALTGWLLYKWDYMDTELSYDEARTHFQIDEQIRLNYDTVMSVTQ